MKKLLIETCPNQLARAVWVKKEQKEECMKALESMPCVESVSGSLGPTQISVILTKLAEKEDIDEMSATLRKITGV